MIDAQSPMYGPYKSAQEQARVAEREAMDQAIAEEKAKQDVVPRLDQIEQKLRDWAAIIENSRLLRGDWPMRVDGQIVSIDPSVLRDDSKGEFLPENTCVNGQPGVQYVLKRGPAVPL